MRILLATAGSRGDVEPFAALARRAAAAGHDVHLTAPDNSGVDLTGLDVRSMGVDYSRLIADQGVSPLAALRSFRSVVRPVMRGVIVGAARAAMEVRPDVIVAHPKVLSAPLAAAALGVPHVLAELVPAMTPTRAFPAAGTVTADLGPLNPLTYRAASPSARLFRADLDEAARIVGGRASSVPPPAATLMPVSPAILSRPADWPASLHLTGPWRAIPAPTSTPAAPTFLGGRPFVYAGFGSMAMGDPVARARTVVEAVRARGLDMVLATGLGGLQVPDELADAPDVHVVQTIDHDAVLPHAVAAVHHGGVGTVHAAVAAGIPSVVIPFIADQPFWGARLRERGLAPAAIPQRRLTARRLAGALVEADGMRPAAADAGAAMSREDGTGAAVGVIERLG